MAFDFHPEAAIVANNVRAACVASVIIPVRNEEGSIAASLDALSRQVDLRGDLLAPDCFEVLMLLNNCTDQSAAVAHGWQRQHPEVALHIAERQLHGAAAHVGTARRLLMDTAWRRLDARGSGVRGILSTDSDTIVAQDWVAQNLRALREGADAVGGEIRLKAGELGALPNGARRSYRRDRLYQKLVAELEALLDPQPGDPWPRHLENFGASLACTPEIYARVGGMPAVSPLEDVAFVAALKRVNACIRHDLAVTVYTSSRFDGRAEIGLSHQLRTWQHMSETGESHIVPSAQWLVHRLKMLNRLRRDSPELAEDLEHCERLIEEEFRGRRYCTVDYANRTLRSTIQALKT